MVEETRPSARNSFGQKVMPPSLNASVTVTGTVTVAVTGMRLQRYSSTTIDNTALLVFAVAVPGPPKAAYSGIGVCSHSLPCQLFGSLQRELRKCWQT